MMMCSADRAGQDGSRPETDDADTFMIGSAGSNNSPAGKTINFEYAAADMHAANRQRVELFRHAVMADKVMDIMLTALIAHEQGTRLTCKAAAMANRLPDQEAERLIADLTEAQFLEALPAEQAIRLTSAGVDRMREYIRFLRNVPAVR